MRAIGETSQAILSAFADARRALLRATLIFGPIALLVVLALQPKWLEETRSSDRFANRLDEMATGSIATERHRDRTGAWPAGFCLSFPDGSRRGAC